MARIRSIKPEFFKHDELFDAEQETGLPLRVAFAGLWTQCDREGRFEWRPRVLKTDVLPYDDVDFSRVLDALATRGFIRRYTVDGNTYGCVPSWNRHQVVNGRERTSEIPEPPAEQEDTHACLTRGDASGTRHGNARGEGEGEGELEEEKTHNARAREDGPDGPPPGPTDGADEKGGATDGTENQTATTTGSGRGYDVRALRVWERWNALRLPLPESVPEEEHLENLSRLFTGAKPWKASQVMEAVDRCGADPEGLAWVADKGPGYLAHRPRGRPQVIEQVLTARRGSEAGPSGPKRETADERAKRIVAARRDSANR